MFGGLVVRTVSESPVNLHLNSHVDLRFYMVSAHEVLYYK